MKGELAHIDVRAILAGRVAVVTGAAQGIGASIAQVFADHGAFVVATDVQFPARFNDDALPAPVDGTIVQRALDVTADADWIALAASVTASAGRLDILVNNAAVAEQGSLEEIEITDWNRVTAVGLTGTWLGMQHCAALLKAAGTASVVNIGSIYGGASAPWGRSPAYHATKGGVLALTRNAAALWAEQGIRVNTVSPGIVVAGDQIDTPDARRIIESTPMRRAAQPAEIAKAVLFVASDWASYMTGAELLVDGGWSAV